MAEKLTHREGFTRYNQSIVEASQTKETTIGKSDRKGSDSSAVNGSTTSTQHAETVGTGKRDTVSTRDLTASTTVSRKSAEKANIAFNIAFKVPILGRFPGTNTSC